MIAFNKMASNIAIVIACIALSSVTSMPGSAILKKLYEQAAHNHRPILVMVTNIDGHKFKDYLIPKYDKNHLSESVEDVPEVVMVKPKPGNEPNYLPHNDLDPIKSYYSKPKPGYDVNPLIYRPRTEDSEIALMGPKKTSKSPILKELLRFSNNLRCSAKNQCQDSCSDKFSGRTKDSCAKKCEVKYDCEEEKEDSCELGDCYDSNECNDDECQPSTRGIKLESVKAGCTRC
ncbi:uncharacterized protein LOC110384988 [Bombyx mori]|uniref:Seminal fluid protein 25 n=1 Tax=Bombyx mori TaxID=7091 RepID=H9JUT0_BOMMO|nr:uncharacterized protein LOC110384988 [Bombyx mori]BAS68530.1 seminal fluid protein 25 [Bombyx mori]